MEADTVKTKLKRERVPWAPPEVVAREATPEETPKPAATLAKQAREAGWVTVVTYARGTTDSDSPKLVHSVAVRMCRGPQRAVTVWTCPVEGKASWTRQMGARLGRWKCEASGLDGLIPIKLGANDLKTYLLEPLPVANDSLPEDVWAAGLDVEMIEGLERLASLFADTESIDA